MDAESRKRRRESCISLREQRWSMSSQKLEQIVAALMKPVSHHGQSFDRDDSGLLEEYLTAAGLHALAEQEAGRAPPPPNYAEVGMLLQSVANNYSRKVDLLCKLVASFSTALNADNLASTSSPEVDPDESPLRAASGRRRRDTSPGAGAGFEPIRLTSAGAARRAPSPAHPPPTLPRVYAELQPRAAPQARPDRALHDYSGEPIGSMDDFRLLWRLQDGYLVEELESGAGGDGGGEALGPLSLLELQAACARGAAPPAAPPPSPPPPSPSPPSPSPPPCLPPPAAAALKRKRRSEVLVSELVAGPLHVELHACAALAHGEEEFCVCERWVRRVVRHRASSILTVREDHAELPETEFRGYDSPWNDIGGFCGWTDAEISEAQETVVRVASVRGRCPPPPAPPSAPSPLSAERGGSGSRSGGSSPAPSAAPAAPGTLDQSGAPELAALARDVARVLGAAPLAWGVLQAATASTQPEPSRVLLDVLMKASRGEVEIVRGDPLTVGDFYVRARTPPPQPDPPPEP